MVKYTNKVKRQKTVRKIFVLPITDKGLIFVTYKNSFKIEVRRKDQIERDSVDT